MGLKEIIVLLFFIQIYVNIYRIIETFVFPSYKPNPNDLILKYGYKSELHHIRTEDGYILSVNRIPPKYVDSTKPPIILLHGLYMSAADYVKMGPNISAAYTFSDAGYDVWLINFRGSIFSRKHIKLNPDSEEEFWNFSIHEIGYYDVPALIDYVLNFTNSKHVHAISFSQGAAALSILLGEKPQYNEKVKSSNMVAPAAYVGNSTSLLLRILAYSGNFATYVMGKMEFLSSHGYLIKIYNYFCINTTTNINMCLYLMDIVLGINKAHIDMNSANLMILHLPSGASSKQVHHFGQLCRSGEFMMYDYGDNNVIKYEQSSPPKYNLSKITVHNNIYYGTRDIYVTKPDILKMKQNLPKSNVQEVPKFNHMEFMFGTQALELIYRPILKSIQEYDSLP